MHHMFSLTSYEDFYHMHRKLDLNNFIIHNLRWHLKENLKELGLKNYRLILILLMANNSLIVFLKSTTFDIFTLLTGVYPKRLPYWINRVIFIVIFILSYVEAVKTFKIFEKLWVHKISNCSISWTHISHVLHQNFTLIFLLKSLWWTQPTLFWQSLSDCRKYEVA